MKEFINEYKEVEFVRQASPQNCRIVPREISLLRQSTKAKTAFTDSEEEKERTMNISSSIRENGVKQRVRKFLQAINHSYSRLDKIALKTQIGTRIKKFKNKSIIEVSDPQTDYKFFRKI